MRETAIHWTEAQAQQIQEQREMKQSQRAALIEFTESDFLVLDSSDFEYYAGATGLHVETLVDIATSQTMIRAKQLQETTKDLWTRQYSEPLLKYNPFKKLYYKFCVHLEKWRPARIYELQNI